jgi:hypothetical protein
MSASPFPRARTTRLVIRELADETLVYDLESHRAHWLNRATALVWGACDGKTDVQGLAAILERDLGLPAEPDLVWLALRQLERSGLLAERVSFAEGKTRVSRRELARRLGVGLALLLPAAASIVAPTPAHAASCIVDCAGQPNGTPCNPPACVNVCSGGACNPP